MTEKILKKLYGHEYVSGEKISEELGITRSAVWKYIKSLRQDGYEIDSVTNKGYKLLSSPCEICKEQIEARLKTDYIGRKLYVFDKVTSTFDEAEKTERESGTVVIARKQTNGRGRLGREWKSDNGGIYFSVILKPDISPDKLQLMTAICAIGVQTAISEYIDCKIKWPNDIVSQDGKKLCGILTKMQICIDEAEYINVGIGINANTDFFPEELKYASSIKLLSGHKINENELLCSVLYNIEKCINEKNTDIIIQKYKENCITLNSRVKVIYATGGQTETGTCTDIMSDASLIITNDNGKRITVNSGEVSVRGIYGEQYV